MTPNAQPRAAQPAPVFVVTGAGGYVGGAVARRLALDGRHVRGLVRRAEQAAELRRAGIEPFVGDLCDDGSLAGLLTGGEVVIHAAARADLRGRPGLFERDTVEATRGLLRLAGAAPPRRFVLVSSAAVYGGSAFGAGRRAPGAAERPAPWNHYGRAKLKAERCVREHCDGGGVPWTILRLGVVYGGEASALHDHVARLLRKGRLRLIGDGANRIATLHLDDAVEGIILAATHPEAAGRVYELASDECVTQAELLTAVAQALGLPPPTRRLDRRLAWLAAAAVETLALRLRPQRARHWRSMVAMLSSDQHLDCSLIRGELGWRPRRTLHERDAGARAWRQQAVSNEAAGSSSNDAPRAGVTGE
ncbi:MAG: NAD(P)-dependent oxidoreductase [Phycisphaerae bacterium]|nr:NAD(P)-dependent oxidoreductase [Phycisphaerae bacterium]MCZ2398384.1 NAD(P)-dependent oxidoreductase [Phycisphaerae bacterium]